MTDGRLVELFVAEKGTFTIVITAPSGISCLIVASDNWDGTTNPTSNLPELPFRMH
jgi:hypothetical protein